MAPPVDPLLETLSAESAAQGSTLATISPSASAPIPPVDVTLDSLPPARVRDDGDYRVRSELGRGGMGVVELAEQVALRRDVAIKRLAVPGAHAAESLLREATVTGQLEHPNIVPVHALVHDGNGPAVVMKRITGESWLESLDEGHRSVEANLQVFLQVCNAVAFAHSRGVVHRDIKPENVMLGEYGEVYLVDWGLAHRVSEPAPERIAGTPAYMPPEFLEGVADERSDIFLLGATLQHVLTGKPRYDGENVIDVLVDVRRCARQRLGSSVPEELAAICNRACAKLPADRFASAADVRDAVAVYLEHRSANDLSDAARSRIDELSPFLQAPTEETYADALRLFNEARFGYQQALRAWPESPAARDGLERALESMARYELALKHTEQAAAMLDAMRAPPPPLREQVDQLRTDLAAERARLEQLEKDQDRGFGAVWRTRAQMVLGVAVVALTSVLVGLRLAMPEYATPAMRLAIVGVIVFAVTSAIVAWWRRRGEWNMVNRRIAQVALSTLAMSMLNRFAALLADAPAPQTLLIDAFLIALGGAALTPYQRSGPFLAALALLVGFVGTARPDWIQTLFVGLAMAVPAVLLFYAALQRRP